jgi:hypothetical protein
MRIRALLLLPILLTGCLEDKGAVYARCTMGYNNMRSTGKDGSAINIWEGTGDYMRTCMRSEGYILHAANCKSTGFVWQELSCYHRVGFIDSLINPNDE